MASNVLLTSGHSMLFRVRGSRILSSQMAGISKTDEAVIAEKVMLVHLRDEEESGDAHEGQGEDSAGGRHLHDHLTGAG